MLTPEGQTVKEATLITAQVNIITTTDILPTIITTSMVIALRIVLMISITKPEATAEQSPPETEILAFILHKAHLLNQISHYRQKIEVHRMWFILRRSEILLFAY